jgi:hypothetical protein
MSLFTGTLLVSGMSLVECQLWNSLFEVSPEELAVNAGEKLSSRASCANTAVRFPPADTRRHKLRIRAPSPIIHALSDTIQRHLTRTVDIYSEWSRHTAHCHYLQLLDNCNHH